ncbi:uncharacterized protein LOC106662942 [Cimex lectularius]|uniref:Allatotropin n=1 Tax=Cimex lectularius TaxID=79782 RepID=A0A8I6RGG2_CIMLE|nr:uncharacterized protein LOC106662942 [Cimex lectularius]
MNVTDGSLELDNYPLRTFFERGRRRMPFQGPRRNKRDPIQDPLIRRKPDSREGDIDPMRWILVAVCLSLATVIASTSARSSGNYAREDRGRSTRGFKNGPLNTARGFGKRSLQEDLIPADWMADEITSNPDLARLLVRRFMDVDQDGFVSPLEFLRPPLKQSCQPEQDDSD